MKGGSEILWALALLASTLGMIAIAAAGFAYIYRGIVAFFHGGAPGSDDSQSDGGLLQLSLQGLELLFLAPLPFLLVRGIGKYLEAGAFPEEIDRARRGLLEVKGFITALMFATVATSLLQRIVSEQGVSLTMAIGGSLVMLLIGAFYVCVERLARC